MKVSQPRAADPVSSGKEGADRPRTRGAVAVALAVLVVSVYWQVGGHDFVAGDDQAYVVENAIVRRGLSLEGVVWAVSSFHVSNWHPLTWVSHMLDVEIFGASAAWHHRMNALYHLLNTELLFLVLWRMTGGLWRSAFVAALFGVHPLHVESVAWVAERKDVLSALFWILTMGAYLRFVRRPGTGRYLVVATLFALGLTCKPMVVTLPFVLLLLDYWPLGRMAPAEGPDGSWRTLVPRLSRLAREKVPLFLLSGLSCIVTYLAQAGDGAVYSSWHLPLASRVANAFVSCAGYLSKTVWPSSLAVYYPHPARIHASVPTWEVAGAILLVCVLCAAVFWQGCRRPYLAVGWLWFLGTLVPVIGLVQVGAQAHADRYTYLPLVGIFVAAAWGIPPLLPAWRCRRTALAVSAGAVLAVFAVVAWLQAGYWRDGVTLYSRAVAVTQRNWFALNGLGVSQNGLGRHREALASFEAALRIRPDYAEAWQNLGFTFSRLGRLRQAVDCFAEAARVKPDYAEAFYGLGASHAGLGEHAQGAAFLREALRIRPDYVEAWNALGVVQAALGQFPEAAGCFREALRIRPDDLAAQGNLAAVAGRPGRP